jgi:hypothetical protein
MRRVRIAPNEETHCWDFPRAVYTQLQNRINLRELTLNNTKLVLYTLIHAIHCVLNEGPSES